MERIYKKAPTVKLSAPVVKFKAPTLQWGLGIIL